MYLGLDIGGTKIAAGLVTPEGRVLQRAACPTPASDGGAAVLQAALALARTLWTPDVQGIGIGAGGQIDAERGLVLSATDLLPGWAGTPLRDAFQSAFPVPAFAENDVNALAVGEYRFGAARGLATVLFLALGTGIGGALLLHGRLHHGAHGAGAEFGHILLSPNPDARRDAGGHLGTLEAYASGPALLQTWRELTPDFPSDLSGPDIAAHAARDPHGPAARAITQTGEYLGLGLVTLANALDPDIIIIGGGLAALGDALLAPARHVLQTRALPGPATCPVVTAALGPDAALIGAASLAMPAPNAV